MSFFAHKSELGRFGTNISLDAIICCPESADETGAFFALRATTFLVLVDATLATGFVVCCSPSPKIARAETPPDATFTTGKRALANDGNIKNIDNTEIVIRRIFPSLTILS